MVGGSRPRDADGLTDVEARGRSRRGRSYVKAVTRGVIGRDVVGDSSAIELAYGLM